MDMAWLIELCGMVIATLVEEYVAGLGLLVRVLCETVELFEVGHLNFLFNIDIEFETFN